MSALVIGGVIVPVAPGGAQEQAPLEVGEVVNAFDGTERSSVRAYKRRWQITTRPLSAGEESTLRAALLAAPPLSVTGDLVGGGPISCGATITGGTTVKLAEGLRSTLTFTLRVR